MEAGIADLKDKKREALKAVSAIADAIRAKELDLAREKYGVTVGCRVWSDGIEHEVVTIDAHWIGVPWIGAKRKRKDGTWGNGVRNIYALWTLEPDGKAGD